MSIFTVISLADGDPVSLRQKIEEKYPDNYIPAARRTSPLYVLMKRHPKLRGNLGMNVKSKILGVVIKHETWYGFSDLELWDWGNKVTTGAQ